MTKQEFLNQYEVIKYKMITIDEKNGDYLKRTLVFKSNIDKIEVDEKVVYIDCADIFIFENGKNVVFVEDVQTVILLNQIADIY